MFISCKYNNNGNIRPNFTNHEFEKIERKKSKLQRQVRVKHTNNMILI